LKYLRLGRLLRGCGRTYSRREQQKDGCNIQRRAGSESRSWCTQEHGQVADILTRDGVAAIIF